MIEFFPEIPVSSLSFEQPLLNTTEGSVYNLALSAVKAGSVTIHSLKGRNYTLRAHQRLSFARARGTIRNLSVEKGEIKFLFLGDVEGMITGSENNLHSLMPSQLEWWLAQDRLILLWTTFLSGFGLVFGIVKWWMGSR